MTWESSFKIGLPAIPLMYTVLAVWGYWGENPVALLPPQIAFWGVVITFYLFTHIYLPDSRAPFFMTLLTSLVWLISSLTSHGLARIIASNDYQGFFSLLLSKDLWFSYGFSFAGFGVAFWQFVIHEPRIVAEARRQRQVGA